MSQLILLFIFVISISFLCSILESILLSINMSYISLLEEINEKKGKDLRNIKINIDQSISSILILNTVANTLGATAIGIQAQKVFNNDDTFVLAITILLTFCILFFSEIIPKTIGAIYWKKLAPYSIKPIKIFVFLTYPIILITLFITKKINKNNKHNHVSREELLHTTLLSEELGNINTLESDIIENTLKIKDIKIKDILTPRSVMFSLEKNTSIKDVLIDEHLYKFSRIPVFDKTIDNIIGVVFTKNILKEALSNKETLIGDIIVPLNSYNENIPVSKALSIFTKSKEHMILVTDNYDQTEGIVTLEDCLETILGLEIMDEHDTTEDMRQLASENMKIKRKLKENNK